MTADELVEASKEHRKNNRLEEALLSSLAASVADPENAEAWWQVALNRRDLGDTKNQIIALRIMVDLVPQFSRGWSQLGNALSKSGEHDAAKSAHEVSIGLDPDNFDALEALAAIYRNQDLPAQDEKEMTVLARIEVLEGLGSNALNRQGALQYRNRHLHEAIRYWAEDASENDSRFSLFNIGLAYAHPDMSQEADAIDTWRLVARRYPDYDQPDKSISATLPKLLERAKSARLEGDTVLSEDLWHSEYINPFQLLNPPSDLEFDEFDAKAVQRLRKSLLREIDLENGNLPWMPGVIVDRSRAIGICEELSDDDKKTFHWRVFENKPLLDFLSKGSHEHFLVNEHFSPLDFLELVQDETQEFREWLSNRFAPQFDRVLSRAIDQRNLTILECVLDGRRWVSPSYADRCFENSRRVVGRLLDPLRKAANEAGTRKLSSPEVTRLLEENGFLRIINLLPTPFLDQQDEAAIQLRRISIASANDHGDLDLAKVILNLADRLRFKSAEVVQRLQDDLSQVEEMIREERKAEVRLTSAGDTWEITKKGIRQGDLFIPTAEVTILRWGSLMTRRDSSIVYDYRFHVAAADGGRVKFDWTTKDGETSQTNFSNLINAALEYIFIPVCIGVQEQIAKGSSVKIGPCTLSSQGVAFETKGWISSKTHLVPWERVRCAVKDGIVTMSDSHAAKVKIDMALRDTDNAPLLTFLSRAMGQDEG
ncbi:tetratricopeptide repeat protein [Microvirga brassicacearum]|uniref:Uncharacterized protein n=1 Tax=Microvirga brassicacearum TaxID=2580413 RepID=A0A5N3P732_9HYPH|nr:hypothetical protein [Microvirga brassicacearum]KAB0265539.1 hypothetical protein FEZ63_17865 [Microvirga brassicacearum]